MHKILERAGIKNEMLTPGGRLTYPQLSMLYKIIWLETGDEYLCFTSSTCKLGTFRLLADISARLDTLESALDYVSRFYQVSRDDTSFGVIEGEGEVTIIIDIITLDLDTRPILVEYMVMAWQRYIRWLVGYKVEWKRTTFSHKRPDIESLYPRFFSEPVYFSKDVSSFSFSASHLKRKIRRTPAEVAKFRKLLPLTLFRASYDDSYYSSSVRNLFSEGDIANLPSLTDVSVKMSLDQRTLHRRLEEEGATYQKIKTDYRRDYAIRCLLVEKMKINEISHQMGFSEPPAFCRFFKSATGLSPSKYFEIYYSDN